jgi:hypothetical protein
MCLFKASLTIVIDDTSQGLRKAWSVTYKRNQIFIVLATVITIVNYNHKTFTVQATGTSIIKRLTAVTSSSMLKASVFVDASHF